MMQDLLFRGVRRTLAVALLLLTGCQLFETRPTPGTAALPPPEKSPKLNAGQVADVKIAFARTLEQRGEYDRAEAAYQEALKENPQRADALSHLASLRDRKGKFSESAELYRKALALKPGDADIYCNLGYSCYLQRRWPDAEMNLKQAIALKPEHRQAHNNLGLVLAQTDRADEALAEFRKAGGSEADAHNNLAFGLTLQRRWLEARMEYATALRLDPSLASAQKALKQVTVLASKEARGGAIADMRTQTAPWSPAPDPIPGAFVESDAATANDAVPEKVDRLPITPVAARR
jgi:Tfp pilus assembly protein PilF